MCCSLRCCSIAVPVIAVLGSFITSLLVDGRAWGLFAAWQIGDMPDLSGKTAIVTGPTIGGIGHESAIELARKGAHVVLAGRSKSKGEAAVKVLKDELPAANAEFMELDLSSLKSVKAFATEFKSKHTQLHILLNNAGVMANPFTLTVDGLESQFATNHLGHFFLTKLLMPELEAAGSARVVTTSSAAAVIGDLVTRFAPASFGFGKVIDFEDIGKDAEASYVPFVSYCRSKLANVIFANALDRRVAGKNIFSNSCNPGGIKTNLQVHANKDLGSMGAQMFESFLLAFGLPLKQGALTQLYLGTAPEIEGLNIRGRFYQPQALARGQPQVALDQELQDKLWAVSERLVAPFV